MAMIQCPECGHQISDQAGVCPNCGYVLKKATHFSPKPFIAGGIACACAVLVWFGVTQTTVFCSQEDKILLECAQQVQKELLAPDSMVLYNAEIVYGKQMEAASSNTVSSEENANSGEVSNEVMVYIYYGAGTKAGGITDGICALEKEDGEWEKYSYHEDLDSFEGLDAVTPALENLQIKYTLYNVQEYGKEYSSESIQRVSARLTK